MPRYICKVIDLDKKEYYFEWSTVVDAPVTFGMSLEEFKEYYKERYGLEGLKGLPERLERVEEKGTSSRVDESVQTLFEHNRAGPNESCFTFEEIVDWYCRKQKEP